MLITEKLENRSALGSARQPDALTSLVRILIIFVEYNPPVKQKKMAADKEGYPYRRTIYIWLSQSEYHPYEIKGVDLISTNLKSIWERLQKYYINVEKELHNQEWLRINSYSTFTRQFKMASRIRIKATIIKGIGEKRYIIEQHKI